ncbi:MAG: SRPBCC family protein [Coriobacteriia bacterium]
MATGVEDIIITQPSEREIRIERTFDAPPELIWRALTEAPLLAKWWARGNPMTIERFEPTRGGHWRFVEHAPEGDFGFEGRFRELDPPRLISQTFEWDGEPGHVSVDTVELKPTADGRTMMTDTSIYMTTEDRDGMLAAGMAEGLAQGYAALDELLVSLRQSASPR